MCMLFVGAFVYRTARPHGFANGRFAKLGPLKERLSLNGDDDYDEEGEGHALEDLPRVRIG